MTRYEYADAAGHRWDEERRVSARHDPATCPACGAAGAKQMSVPTIHWAPGTHPVTGTSWHDLYDESPRELAHKKGIERYDPTYQHKPEPAPVNMRPYLADRAEAEGASERLKPVPVEGEDPMYD
jgi:hypothetical protein